MIRKTNLFTKFLTITFLIGVSIGQSDNLKAQGPVQPEAMQFEPVDVTDVVNLATGDFTYTVPILNVPGPEGDYPVVLSYHSGIGPNQPATWVGLGWTLNPGAVNRTISGYPDDYKGDVVKTSYKADEKSSWGLSLGAGIGPVGINMTYDHYTGMVGANLVVSLMSGLDALGATNFAAGPLKNFDVSASIGTDGSASIGANFGRGIKGTKLGAGIGINASTNGGVGIGGGISRSLGGKYENSLSLVSAGASLSSKGSGASFSIGGTGFSSLTENSGGTLVQSGFSAKIPLPGKAWISFGYSKWKWTLDETFSEPSYGTLYQGSGTTSSKRERQKQGKYLMPSKDAFNVAIQGVSGSFMSMDDYGYVLEDGHEYDEKGKIVRQWGSSGTIPTNDKNNFRFLGDQGYNQVDQSNIGFGDNITQMSSERNSGKKVKPVFTPKGKIRGFIITQTDGMIYEFMQPVKNLFQYTKTIIEDGSGYENWNALSSPYATSWYVTAIKGPDFVDRQSDGITDDDWGYWVKFEYERMDEPHLWRAPHSGYAPSGDDAKTFSMGMREVYHLTNIESKTHKAIFESTVSQNGSAPNNTDNITFGLNPRATSTTQVFEYTGDFSWISAAANSTDIVLRITDYNDFGNDGRIQEFEEEEDNQTPYNDPQFNCNLNSSKRTIELQEVTIVYSDIDDVTSITVNSTFQPCPNYVESNARLAATELLTSGFRGHKKLDRVALINKSENDTISKSEFDYDYYLRPNSSGSVAGGALTLNAVHFFGTNNTPSSPPYRFNYAYGELNPSFHPDDIDDWGRYRHPGQNQSNRGFRNRTTPQDKGRADMSAAWSLTNIITPTGSELEIEYESDDFIFVNGTVDFRESDEYSYSNSSDPKAINISGASSNFSIGQIIKLKERKFNWNLGSYENTYLILEEDIRIVDLDGDKVITNKNIVDLEKVPYGDYQYDYSAVIIPFKTYGGGSRVKSTTMHDGLTRQRTLYSFRDGYVSSGVTPSLVESPADQSPSSNYRAERLFGEAFLDNDKSFNRPPPNVVYSKVQVINVDENDKPVNGMTEYEFYTARDAQYKVDSLFNFLKIKDRSGIYGKPKATTIYETYTSSSGAELMRPIKKTITKYAFSDELANYSNVYKNSFSSSTGINELLGITQQKHVSKDEYEEGDWRSFEVERQFLNVFQTGNISYDYFYDADTSQTSSRILTKQSKVIGFNASTGQPIISATQTNDVSEVMISTVTPAHWKYDGFGEMEEKNMLTQVFQETSFRKTNLDIENDFYLKQFSPNSSGSDVISSSVTTWSNSWLGSVWRKNDTFVYVPTYNYQSNSETSLSYTEFPNDSLYSTTNAYPGVTIPFPWKKTSNIVSYDGYGHALETVNEDGTFQSVLYDSDNESLVKAVISNARLNEIVFKDEEATGYHVGIDNAHTGERINCDQGGLNLGSTPTNPPIFGGKYKVGVWVDSDVTVNGVSSPVTSGWRYISLLANHNEQINMNGSGCYDDLTIIPAYASISYFTYDPLTWKVASMTGPDNRTSYFEYDNAGRLIATRDMNKNILQVHDYGYGQELFIYYEPERPEPGDRVEFKAIPLRSGYEPGEYSWSFGNGLGKTTTTDTTSLIYNTDEEFNVTLTYLKDGKTLKSSRRIKIGSSLTLKLSGTVENTYGSYSSVDPDEEVGQYPVHHPEGGDGIHYKIDVSANVEGGVKPYNYTWYKKAQGESNWTELSDKDSNVTVIQQSTTPSAFILQFKCVITDYDNNSVEKTIFVSNQE
ncbi:hypothetical protein A8B79_15695 [Balneola sp. EhC07]|uniref:hypothetical protein n=1 Tax=Balneola sp. EhC07 TaxID=1849360 RepID=UPI0007F3BA0B|nr:hypothetical protein [Balneola sp. EhC07]OAN63256.1 hypothetical protein A8B79_15695 [Balneola sp. EhC07]